MLYNYNFQGIYLIYLISYNLETGKKCLIETEKILVK